MATIDEILAAMPEPSAEGDHEYLVIDPATRSITVPEAEKIFGVTGDELADRKYFICPRIVGDGLDLASMFIRVNFRNANGEEDGYLVKDVAVSGDYVTFSWQLTKKVAAYKGEVLFGVCADLPNTPDRKMPDWNTAVASGEVLEGLHPEDGDVEGETSDVVTQLRAETAAQTAAVEACGAAQVDVVEAAGAAATADAQAQIQAKGAATLATIPADYTTMAGKVNEQANAIKGNLSGDVIRANDVSPVEHELAAKVRSKNLITPFTSDYSATHGGITRTCEANGQTITMHGKTESAGGRNALSGFGGTMFLEAGKTYTLSHVLVSGEVTGKYSVHITRTEDNYSIIYVRSDEVSRTFSVDMDMLCHIGINAEADSSYFDAVIGFQVEEGTEATAYTPYIDPAGVTVTRCGKNLTAHTAATKTDKQHGLSLTRTHNSAKFIVDGTATEMSSMVATSSIMLPPGTYTASVKGLNIIDAGADRVYLWNQPDGKVVQNGIMDGVPKTFTLAAATPVRAELVFAAGSSYSNKTVEIQIERGTAATAFEEYAAATAMPDESGTVTGLPSLAPTMTLLTDTAGVKIECTYNRDSNAVYAELLDKIAALSGKI